ncbi:MAG: imidazole glycerol phosphate synthase subunit HisH [Halobacteriales archaeon]
MEISIVDYGLGNLRSVTRGLERAGASVSVTGESSEVGDAEALVLPGVGAFHEGMRGSRDLHDALLKAADDGVPLLGICLGMQMLMSESMEGGEAEGLDLVEGRVVRFPSGVGKVPHMGWNDVDVVSSHPVMDGVDGEYFYFVHSFYAERGDGTVASAVYGGDVPVEFSAVVSNDDGNVVGTQFHPEKSGEAGLKVLSNFVEYAEST